ncbi:MAG: hypothetical protein FD123_4174 [Bacteroidetes bacterium]|nr:MAG: hypothetical protein FD123_4174 [Bacteroidota bacterium]
MAAIGGINIMKKLINVAKNKLYAVGRHDRKTTAKTS